MNRHAHTSRSALFVLLRFDFGAKAPTPNKLCGQRRRACRCFTCTTTRATGGKRANDAVRASLRDYFAGNNFSSVSFGKLTVRVSWPPPPLGDDEMKKENEWVSILHIKVVACLYSQSLRAAPCFPRRHTSAKCSRAGWREKWPRVQPASPTSADRSPRQKGKLFRNFCLTPFDERVWPQLLWGSKLPTINSCEKCIKGLVDSFKRVSMAMHA